MKIRTTTDAVVPTAVLGGKEKCRKELAKACDAPDDATWEQLLIGVRDDRELLYDQLLKERPL